MLGVFSGGPGCVPGITHYPQYRGRVSTNAGGALLSRQTLPEDPAGTYTLRLENIVPGSRFRVEADQSGVALAEGIATQSVVSIPLQLYAAGSPLNSLRIKVRKASEEPYFRPFESQATAQSGVVAVFVFQEPDE